MACGPGGAGQGVAPQHVSRVRRVVTVTEEPLEQLVASRIREQLGEGGLESLIVARHRIQEGLDAQLGLEVQIGLEASAEVTAASGEVVAIVESASPELADDIKGLSPEKKMLYLTYWLAFVTTLQFLVMRYQTVYGQPPTQSQIIEIVNQTNNVYNQIASIVINMPPQLPG